MIDDNKGANAGIEFIREALEMLDVAFSSEGSRLWSADEAKKGVRPEGLTRQTLALA